MPWFFTEPTWAVEGFCEDTARAPLDYLPRVCDLWRLLVSPAGPPAYPE